ncbi:MAG: hypothetical protein H6818_05155 [Phycisphaerales bacterium]|nr:hypothetical protein [Phycisphaerales bacterium]MCB9863427.1 hypothetical protein [Phycisphaerales bacterium]
MTPSAPNQKWRAPVAIAAVCIAALSYYMFGNKNAGPRIRDDIDVHITRIDVPKSEVDADFVHPKDGKTYPITARIGSDCRITIDGAPAKLADLKVGDRAIGKGSLSGGVVQAMAIRVLRQKKGETPAETGGHANGRPATGG